MTITELRDMTLGELIEDKELAKKATLHSYKTQVILKDGTFTVKTLIKLAGFEVPAWGA